MFTPAISASSTSSPRVMRRNASSTPVRGPPFLNLFPLAEAMTTGREAEVLTAGAWPNAGAAVATAIPVPARTKSRRVILPLVFMTAMLLPGRDRARDEHCRHQGHRRRRAPFTVLRHPAPIEAGQAGPGWTEARSESGDVMCPARVFVREARGQEGRLLADDRRVQDREIGGDGDHDEDARRGHRHPEC